MIDYEQVKRDAAGRWEGIYSALGVEVGDGRHTACPVCGGNDRFRMDNKEGKGSWYCSQCVPHAGDGWALLRNVLGITFTEALEEVGKIIGTIPVSNLPKKEKTASPDYLRKLFQESEPADKYNLVGCYLENRGLDVVPGNLRLTAKCYEPESKKYCAAMLAVFSLPSGEAVTMHRTFLSPDGDKLCIEKPKKILPPLQKMTGGSVQLFPCDESGIIAITEGIETAIAVHEDTGLPVCAALSATLLEGFEPPVGTKHVAIFGDNDRNYAGQKAAMVLANKISIKHKLSVEVFIPHIPGDDWLDDLNRRKNKGKQ